uniref:ANK_REP_REGION domain-containing protein n=1 Tax=Ascaris lumbricoides TaxID=6252 RepID=A0A0M3HKH6_ASCLU
MSYDILEIIEQPAYLAFHRQTLNLYCKLAAHGNQKVAHILCGHVGEDQLMYAVKSHCKLSSSICIKCSLNNGSFYFEYVIFDQYFTFTNTLKLSNESPSKNHLILLFFKVCLHSNRFILLFLFAFCKKIFLVQCVKASMTSL